MTTYEYRIIVNEELYDQNPEEILHEVRNMALRQLSSELKSVDREKMELLIGILDEKTMSRTITVTYRDDAPVEPEEEPEDLEYCSNCAESFNYCVCGDEATAPTAQEIWDALPDVEAVI
jgi:hypothetical protein